MIDISFLIKKAISLDPESTQEVVFEVIKNLLAEAIAIKEVRSGGQTGADEFGILAAQRLGLKCSILAPQGYRMHYREGEEIEGYSRFVKHFMKIVDNSRIEPAQYWCLWPRS